MIGHVVLSNIRQISEAKSTVAAVGDGVNL
jgi:cation transport ATPase